MSQINTHSPKFELTSYMKFYSKILVQVAPVLFEFLFVCFIYGKVFDCVLP